MTRPLLLVLCLLFCGSLVTAQVVTIPDANLKAALVGDPAINTNGDGEIQVTEAQAFTGIISVGAQAIADMTGIEAFINLETLVVDNNDLTSLDVTALDSLTVLWCNNNDITALDLSNNASLEELRCNNNDLTTLDLSNNTLLELVFCSDNSGLASVDLTGLHQTRGITIRNGALTTVDVSDCASLLSLNLGSNDLLTINVTNNSTLEYLNLGSNTSLSTLDVSANDNLERLDLYNTDLDSLDLTSNPVLYELNCSENNLTELDVSGNPLLAELSCAANLLTELDVSNNPDLWYFDCGRNLLTELDLQANDEIFNLICVRNDIDTLILQDRYTLEFLSIGDNDMRHLGIAGDTSLRRISGADNDLTSLDLTDNHNLEWLVLPLNRLHTLDLSNLPDLERLELNTNQLTSLDVHANPLLNYVRCSANDLYALDFSNNPLLTYLRCVQNDSLRILNMANGNNTAIGTFNTLNCANLDCIQVDDSTYSATNWPQVDDAGLFSEDCGFCYPSFATVQASTCAGDAYTAPDGSALTISQDTVFVDVLTANSSCDSIITVSVDVSSATTATDMRTACDSLTWIDGITYTTDNASATYVLTGSNGCDSTVLLDLTVQASPAITIAQDGASLDATAGLANYQWFDASGPISGATTATFTPSGDGSYFCETVENGCTGRSNTIDIGVTGLRDGSFQNALSLVPNPAHSMVVLRAPSHLTHIELVDMTGQVVRRFDATHRSLDVSGIAPGICGLHVRSDAQSGFLQLQVK